MLIIALCASAPNCFSTQSYLEGEIQSRLLSIFLIPQVPLDPLCLALDGTDAAAELIYEGAATSGIPVFTAIPFVYRANVTNEVVFSIASLRPALITTLIEIVSAEYVVKIQKAGDYRGTLNQIKYLKTDVSSCWSNLVFSYSAIQGDEKIFFELSPNDCTIPEDAKLYPRITFQQNTTNLVMNEFEQGTDAGDYKHPYVHNQVTRCQLQCKEIVDAIQKQTCLTIIDFITTNLQYRFGVVLIYDTVGIETIVIQDAIRQQAEGSLACGEKTSITCYLNPDSYILYHDQFRSHPECVISADSVVADFSSMLTYQDQIILATTEYSLEIYGTTQYFVKARDLSKEFKENMTLYAQSIQRDEDGGISGQFYMRVQVVKQCIYLAVITVSGRDKIALQIRSTFDDLCSNITETMELLIISSRLEVVFQQAFEIAIDSKAAIQSIEYQTNTDVASILAANPGSVFTVRGPSFYMASAEINYDNYVMFLAIQLSCFALFLVAGLATVLVVIRRQAMAE
ncbi:hypothetical protein SS50377_28563 [Spironucleus salmonicida]|uniref:Uncharacterized protein n=1 Tax=Spironucleus salmonicida TaxID=348837 RepID=V6LB19_9EUKA|nr:hypothetical protein SS50377_28563 [Spironucleus salmonicida]|eukprot:EST41612.1 hypothetical protein SS50377_18961 [Spironucleus salmonicida]